MRKSPLLSLGLATSFLNADNYSIDDLIKSFISESNVHKSEEVQKELIYKATSKRLKRMERNLKNET